MKENEHPTKLVTIVIGETYVKDFNETARDRFNDYAKRCGYEPVIITKPIREIPGKELTWQKLCLHDLPWFKEGTHIICLDCDILITKDAPPFPEVPSGYIGAVLDKDDIGINSGVLVYEASQKIADIFDECHKDPDPYWDQFALNRVLHQRKRFHPIAPHFHCMFYVRSWTLFRSLFRHYWLYHSLSSKKKLTLIGWLLQLQHR